MIIDHQNVCKVFGSEEKVDVHADLPDTLVAASVGRPFSCVMDVPELMLERVVVSAETIAEGVVRFVLEDAS